MHGIIDVRDAGVVGTEYGALVGVLEFFGARAVVGMMVGNKNVRQRETSTIDKSRHGFRVSGIHNGGEFPVVQYPRVVVR